LSAWTGIPVHNRALARSFAFFAPARRQSNFQKPRLAVLQ
jgi:hypothetical protein